MRQNNSVGECSGVGVVTCKVINKVWIVLLVWMVLWIRCGWLGNEKTLAWALPNEKTPVCDSILTDSPIPDIHISAYLIPVFQII